MRRQWMLHGVGEGRLPVFPEGQFIARLGGEGLKIYMVTGANAGIGKATALELAKQGETVVMVCRRRERGETAQKEIIAQSGNQNVDLLIADLSSQVAIRQLVKDFQSRYDRLHVLINNAAVALKRRQLSVDGIEMMFAVNHLSYFLLTYLLLDTLKASAPARIINVASNAHRFGRLDFDDLQGEKRYFMFRAYAQSKLENVYFTYTLAKRLEGTGVTVNALHPGVIRSDLNRELPGFLKWFFDLFMKPAEKGAETPVYLATSPEVEGISGKYWDECRQIPSAPPSYDEEVAERLWQVSAKLCGLTVFQCTEPAHQIVNILK